MKPQNIEEIRRRFIAASQGHVFNAWDELTEHERDALLGQCAQMDVLQANELF